MVHREYHPSEHKRHDHGQSVQQDPNSRVHIEPHSDVNDYSDLGVNGNGNDDL